MNHIYKVVLCKTTGLFVAVAETAKSNGKRNSQVNGQVDTIDTQRTTQGVNYLHVLPNVSHIFNPKKLVLILSIIGTGLIGQAHADQTIADNLIVTGNTTIDGTLTVGGDAVATQADLANKADKTALDAVNTTVGTKANQTDLDKTNATVATKADKTALDAVNTTVSTKANQTDLDKTNATVATKADKTALDATNTNVTNLQTSLSTLGVNTTTGGIKYFRTNSTAPDAQAIGIDAVAIGPNSVATADNALAINGATIAQKADKAIAIGTQAAVLDGATKAVAIGSQATINTNATSAIAMGDKALVDTNLIGAIAIGNQATATERGVNSLAIGTSALTRGNNSIAVGTNAQSKSMNTISIGTGAGFGQLVDASATTNEQINIGLNAGQYVQGQKNIAIGTNAGQDVIGQASIAIGNNAGRHLVTEYNSLGENVSIGNNANNYTSDQSIRFVTAVGASSQARQSATAVGYNAKALGDSSVAIGRDTQANYDNSVAIGNSATATYDNVALGTNSIATDNTPRAGYLTGMYSSNVVSVGSGNATGTQYRRIINVADGVADQDAATVAQLRKTKEAVVQDLTPLIQAANGASSTGIYYDPIATSGNSSITLKDGTTISNVAKGSKDTDAVNVGQLNQVVDANKVHYFSWDASKPDQGNYNNGGATGVESLAVGQQTAAGKERSIAFGNYTESQQMGGIAIGTQYIYDPANGIDYKNANAKTATTKVNGNNSIDKYSMAIGAGANTQGSNSIAIGSLASTGYGDTNNPNGVDRAIAVGYGARSTNLSSTAIGDLSLASGYESIAVGTHTETNGTNSGNIGYAGEFGATDRTIVSGNDTYVLGNRDGTIYAKNSSVVGSDNKIVDGSIKGSLATNLAVVGNSNAITYKVAVDGTSVIGAGNTLNDVTTSQVHGNKNKVNANNVSVQGNNNTLTQEAVDGHVVGNNNTLKAAQTIAIGTGNTVGGANSGAIGDPSIINGANSYSVGNNNTIGSTTNNAFILGNNVNLGATAAGVDTTSVSGAIALGNATTVTQASGVALGENSQATIAAGVQGYDPLGAGKAQPAATLASGTWKATNAAVSVGKADGSLTRQIVGVAAGTANTDAVNVAQLKAAQTHYFSVNSTGDTNYNNEGATGQDAIAIGKNTSAPAASSVAIGSNANSSQINSVVVGSGSSDRAATTESSASVGGITYNGFAGQGNTTNGVMSVGTTGKERQVINVAAGKIAANSTDAINGSQLYRTQQSIGNVANSTKNILGGNAALGTDGSLTMSNVGGTGKNNINDAIIAARESVTSNNKSIKIATTQNAAGANIYDIGVNTDNITLTTDASTGVIKAVTSGITTNNGLSTANTPSALATAGDVATAVNNSGFNLTAQGANSSQVKPGSTVDMKNTDGNIVVSKTTSNNTVNYDLAKNIKVDSVAINNSGVSLSNTGLNNGGNKITGVAAGSAMTDAANVGQLTAVAAATKTEVAAGTNISKVTKTQGTNGQDIYTVDANGSSISKGSEAVKITASAKDANNITDYAVDLSDTSKVSLAKADSALQSIRSNNPNVVIGTKDTSGNQTIGLIDNPTFMGAVTAPIFVTSGNHAITMDGNTGIIKGLSNTTYDPTANYTGGQAATQEQVQQAAKAANSVVASGAGTNVTSAINQNGGTTYTVATKVDGVTTQIDANGNVAAVTSGITTNNGLSTANTPSALATAGDVATAVNNSGFNLTAQGANSSQVKPGSTVDMKNTDGNIIVSKTTSNNTVNYDLAKDIKVDSVAINNSGISLGNTGLSNGGNQISNVASGGNIGTNAANINDVIAARTTIKSSDNSISVVNTSAGQGNLAYDIRLNNQGITNGAQLPVVYTDRNGNTLYKQPDGSFNTALDGSGITVATTNIIASMQDATGATTTPINLTNIAPAILSATSTDAVNGSQLYVTNQNVATNTANIAKGLNFTDGAGNVVNKQLGEALPLIGSTSQLVTALDSSGATSGTAYSAKNIQTYADATTGKIQVQMSDNPVFTSVKTGNTTIDNTGLTINHSDQAKIVSLTNTGLNNGGNTLTNVAAGINDMDAVNVSQLRAMQAASTTKVLAGAGTIVTPVTNQDGSTSYTLAAHTDGATITTNPTTGAITAVTSGITTNNGLSTANTPSALATAGDVATAVNNSGFNLTAQGANSSQVKPGSTVDMKNTDGNIIVSKTTSNNTVNYDLAKDIKVDSVAINNSGVSLSNTGLNNGGNTLTNVATGVKTTDAANVGQLTQVKAGQNVIVTTETGSNGQTIYTVNSTSDEGHLISVNGTKPTHNNIEHGQGTQAVINANGNIQINSAVAYVNTNPDDTSTPSNTAALRGANANNPVKLTNVAEGEVSATSKDAVNGSQLYNMNTNIANAINNLGYKITDIEDNANAGISSAMAMGALPQAYLPGKSMVAGGMATYNGQSAVAVGISKLSDNGRWVIKVNGTADTQGNAGGAVGAGFHW